MCIIVLKKQNSGPITEQQWVWLNNCWANNEDGAGFMWVSDGMVNIVKGLMGFDDFKQAVVEHGRDMGGLTVFHFRTATHGTVCPENTHPFPLSKQDAQLSALTIQTNCGIVHNGILPIAAKNEHSDTFLFVRDWLAPFKQVDKKLANMMALIGDKFIVMTPSTTWTIGDFVEDGDWAFSNSGYKAVYVPFIEKNGFHYPISGYAGWGDDLGSKYERHHPMDDGAQAGRVCELCRMWVQTSKLVKAESFTGGADKMVCKYCIEAFWSTTDDWGSTDELYMVGDELGVFDKVEL